jgi:hypothetical protein
LQICGFKKTLVRPPLKKGNYWILYALSLTDKIIIFISYRSINPSLENLNEDDKSNAPNRVVTLFSHRCLCRHAAVARRGKIGNVKKRNGHSTVQYCLTSLSKRREYLEKLGRLCFSSYCFYISRLKELGVDIFHMNKILSLEMIDKLKSRPLIHYSEV